MMRSAGSFEKTFFPKKSGISMSDHKKTVKILSWKPCSIGDTEISLMWFAVSDFRDALSPQFCSIASLLTAFYGY